MSSSAERRVMGGPGRDSPHVETVLERQRPHRGLVVVREQHLAVVGGGEPEELSVVDRRMPIETVARAPAGFERGKAGR